MQNWKGSSWTGHLWISLNVSAVATTYGTTVQTPVLFVLKPRMERCVLVLQETISFGIGLPSCEFQDSHGNITYRSLLMPGHNEIGHEAVVSVSSQPDNRYVPNNIVTVYWGKLSWLQDCNELRILAWNQKIGECWVITRIFELKLGGLSQSRILGGLHHRYERCTA